MTSDDEESVDGDLEGSGSEEDSDTAAEVGDKDTQDGAMAVTSHQDSDEEEQQQLPLDDDVREG